MALGDAFDLVGDGPIGIVCVHGFTGTPYEMRYLGEQCSRAGFHVHGLRLPGHGTNIADLDATRWGDWAGAVEQAFDRMRTTCTRVAVVGQSLGGLLALHLAANRPDVAAVASLAAPLWLDGLAGRVARWAAAGRLDWVRAVPKLAGSDARDRHMRRENPGYKKIPMRALGELARFMQIVGDELANIQQPLLVLHATHDHTAPVACAMTIAQRARAARTRILPRSYHLIAADVEKDIVAREVIDFIQGTVSCAT